MSEAALAVSTLADHEAVIERGLATFVEVGEALAAIRDQRLYRDTHGTFEDYCRDRWGFNRKRAAQMIEAAEVVSTMVDTDLPAPQNERQARALAAVPEPDRAEVWRETLDHTDGKPTARAIAERVQQRTAELRDQAARQEARRAEDEEFWSDVADQAVKSGAAQRIADERPYGIAAVGIGHATRELIEIFRAHPASDLAHHIPDYSRHELDLVPAVIQHLTTLTTEAGL